MQDKKETELKSVANRRNFMKLVGAGAVASGASLVAGSSEAEPALPEQKAGELYQETDHVRRYYELAKF